MAEPAHIQGTPKAELHRHLELCLRPETIRELAPNIGIQLRSEQDFNQHFLILEPMKDLGSVLNKFLDTQKLLSSEEILERMTFEACEDVFLKEGTRIVEFRYAPTFIELGHKMSFDQIHRAIVRGAERAEKKYPMAVGIIGILQRILPVSTAEKVVDFMLEHRSTFVGLDLADNEVGFDSKPFRQLFQRAARAGLGITVHAGEADVPKAPEFVMDAVDILGATRIGHGLQIYKDPAVMKTIRERNIVLELCPTSNWLTNAVPSLAAHPFRKLMEAGVRTTINTDDPSIFATDLNKECKLLKEWQNLTASEMESCLQTAAEASFIPLEKRRKVWPKPLKG